VKNFCLFSSLDKVEYLFIAQSKINNSFIDEIKVICSSKICFIEIVNSDLWIQDTVEFGVWEEEDGTVMPAALLGLRGKHDMGLDCAPLDKAVSDYLTEHFPYVQQISVGEPLPNRRWIDWYGNLEVSPPVPGYPYGRILTGRQHNLTMHPAVLAFLEDNSPQWPPVFVNVSWLTIGHVDEVINFVPTSDGWRVLLPSTQVALEILTQSAKPNEELLEIARSEESKQISQFLRETEQQLKNELGIKEKDIIRLPALFKEGLSVTPNPVNSLVANDQIFIPDQKIPEFNAYIKDKLATSHLSIYFLDAEVYHSRSGEIHCGTNALRTRNKMIAK
jgi:protein-arginine deiminase